MTNKNDLNIIEYSSLLELGTQATQAIKAQQKVKRLCKEYKINKDTITELLKCPLDGQIKFIETIKTFGGFD